MPNIASLVPHTVADSRIASEPQDAITAYVRSRDAVYAAVNQELANYLQSMSDDENRAVIKRVFHHTHPPIDRLSGLVEQQKWFAKFRR